MLKEAFSQQTSAGINPTVSAWLTEIEHARKREEDWQKKGRGLVKLYESGKSKESPFNILYSNTETLAPALYNHTPRPVVKRRYKDADPLGKEAAKVAERLLQYYLDNDIGVYTPFDQLAGQAILETLVPGRGVIRFKYEAEITAAPAAETKEGETPIPAEAVSYETVCGEAVPWDRFCHGYGKQWKDVPWVAFEHFMTREELVKTFGEEVGRRVKLTISGKSEERTDDGKEIPPADAGDCEFAQVFEIWDKVKARVVFISSGHLEGALRDVPDPLELTGFFPCSEPLRLYPTISSLLPVPLYDAYEEQARELNDVTSRISKIVRALKVRGLYDATVEGLEKVLSADDNTLIPAENVAALQQGATLEKSIWLMPLEKLVSVLQQLYIQREQVKQVIYEINGVSDILRGASVASETATAQNIKNQWGTLRLKRGQRSVQVYVRSCLRLVAEIAVTKLSQQTIAAMTGLQYPTAAEKAQMQMALQQAQAAGQPIPPDMAGMLQVPSWEEVLGLLRNDFLRSYRVDIETNSTVDNEATEDKKDVSEYLNAAAQFLNGTAPMVEKGILPFELVKTMLLAVTRRFRFGEDFEDKLGSLTGGQVPDGGGEAAKAQQEAQAAQAAQADAKLKSEVAQVKAAADMQSIQLRAQVERQKAEADMAKLARERQIADLQFQVTMKKLAQEAATPVPVKSTGNTKK